MAKINKVLIGESLVGDGNEVAHIDLIMGPRGSAAETAFCNALTNNKDRWPGRHSHRIAASVLVGRTFRIWQRSTRY